MWVSAISEPRPDRCTSPSSVNCSIWSRLLSFSFLGFCHCYQMLFLPWVAFPQHLSKNVWFLNTNPITTLSFLSAYKLPTDQKIPVWPVVCHLPCLHALSHFSLAIYYCVQTLQQAKVSPPFLDILFSGWGTSVPHFSLQLSDPPTTSSMEGFPGTSLLCLWYPLKESTCSYYASLWVLGYLLPTVSFLKTSIMFCLFQQGLTWYLIHHRHSINIFSRRRKGSPAIHQFK